MLRRRELFVDRYGPVAGPKLYHALQSQAAHASVSARLRRKLDATRGATRTPKPRIARPEVLPLFPDDDPTTDEACDRMTALGEIVLADLRSATTG